MFRAFALLLTCAYTLLAQGSVPTSFLYHHVWAVVPLVGKGSKDDPKRPMFSPSRGEQKARADKAKASKGNPNARIDDGDTPAVLGFTMVLTDDKKSAIVEFVGLNSQSMTSITHSNEKGVITFEQGKANKNDIEKEFQKYKAGFTLDMLHGSNRNNGNGKGGNQ